MTNGWKLQPVLIAMTVANFALLAFMLAQSNAVAAPQPDDGVIRGKGLQIVDDAGKVRASISISPAQKMADGSVYPETVLLRLITAEGRPNVKISSMTDGSGMSLGDAKGLSYVQVLARNDAPEINIVDKAGETTTALR